MQSKRLVGKSNRRSNSNLQTSENKSHFVPNLVRFLRFSTQRVLNYEEQLKAQLQFFCISAILAP
jgi:hypothetical protein